MNSGFSSLLTSAARLAGTSGRVVALTLASALLLAAGEASNTTTDRALQDDSILAPMTPAQAAAATAALAATVPADIAAETAATEIAPEVSKPARLSQLVASIGGNADVTSDADLHCLANAVYFEARGEPLDGQLAVAQAIINRVESGRYAKTICGVINQRGQFSFDRRRTPTAGNDWRTAQAIARIAADDMWHDVTPRAVSFHAARLSPGWKGKVRIAQIGNHVFYR
jgi:spore germination cell wall hydrolase CwlJ-like protein